MYIGKLKNINEIKVFKTASKKSVMESRGFGLGVDVVGVGRVIITRPGATWSDFLGGKNKKLAKTLI